MRALFPDAYMCAPGQDELTAESIINSSCYSYLLVFSCNQAALWTVLPIRLCSLAFLLFDFQHWGPEETGFLCISAIFSTVYTCVTNGIYSLFHILTCLYPSHTGQINQHKTDKKTPNFQWIGQLSATDNVAEDTVKPVGFMLGSLRVRFGMESPDLRPIDNWHDTDWKPIISTNRKRQQTDNPVLQPITNLQHTDHKLTQILISKYAKLTLNRHLFRKWLGAHQTTCHYHKECQVRFLTHVCVKWPQWVLRW